MRNRRATLIMLAATATFWSSLYTYVPILSPYSQRLGASLSLVGFVLASYGFSQLLLRVPIGILSDRLGTRRPFIWAGFVAAIVAAIGMGLATSPWQLLVFRCVSGIAASMWVAFTVLFASYFPEQGSSRAMSIMLFCSASGQLVATYGGGWLAELWGWQAPFWGALILGSLGMVVSLFVHEVPLRRADTVSVRELLRVGRSPQLLTVSLLASLVQYVTFVTVYGFTPSYATAIGATRAQLGALTLVSALPTAIASLLGGTWLTERLGRGGRGTSSHDLLGERRVVAAGFAIAGISTLLIPFIRTVSLLYLSQAIGGAGRGAVFPVLMGMSIRSIPAEKRATAMGVFQSLYALGMTAGPAISGFLGNALGMRGIFITGGVVALSASVLSWIAFRTVLRPSWGAGRTSPVHVDA